MEELKEGDRVTCINDQPRPGSNKTIPLKHGKDYVVAMVKTANGKPHVAVEGLIYAKDSWCKAADEALGDGDPIQWFNPARFKKI